MMHTAARAPGTHTVDHRPARQSEECKAHDAHLLKLPAPALDLQSISSRSAVDLQFRAVEPGRAAAGAEGLDRRAVGFARRRLPGSARSDSAPRVHGRERILRPLQNANPAFQMGRDPGHFGMEARQTHGHDRQPGQQRTVVPHQRQNLAPGLIRPKPLDTLGPGRSRTCTWLCLLQAHAGPSTRRA
jgi:hypothetical protein